MCLIGQQNIPRSFMVNDYSSQKTSCRIKMFWGSAGFHCYIKLILCEYYFKKDLKIFRTEQTRGEINNVIPLKCSTQNIGNVRQLLKPLLLQFNLKSFYFIFLAAHPNSQFHLRFDETGDQSFFYHFFKLPRCRTY